MMHSEAVVLSGNGNARAPDQAPAAAGAPQQRPSVNGIADGPHQDATAGSAAAAPEQAAPRKAGSGGLVVKLSRPEPAAEDTAAAGMPQENGVNGQPQSAAGPKPPPGRPPPRPPPGVPPPRPPPRPPPVVSHPSAQPPITLK